MTREALIRYGKDYLSDLVTACCSISEIHKEFVRESIKALEQKSCEDAVSRKAIDQNIYDYAESNRLSYTNMKNYILDVPPVTPVACIATVKFSKEDIQKLVDEKMKEIVIEHKVGKWTDGDPICPCCGEDKFKDLDADIWSDWKPRYCPNCGAEMEVEE